MWIVKIYGPIICLNIYREKPDIKKNVDKYRCYQKTFCLGGVVCSLFFNIYRIPGAKTWFCIPTFLRSLWISWGFKWLSKIGIRRIPILLFPDFIRLRLPESHALFHLSPRSPYCFDIIDWCLIGIFKLQILIILLLLLPFHYLNNIVQSMGYFHPLEQLR